MNSDKRVTAARADLAALHLKGEVDAPRFVAGEPRVVSAPLAPVRRAPSPDAPLDTEALMGERFTVYESTEEGWSWGQLDVDGYVGWMPSAALAVPTAEPTHRIVALRTLVFPGPSIKAPPIGDLPFGARVAVTRIAEPFAVLASGGFVPSRHVAPLDFVEGDFVAVAERFLGTPYLWGGKSALGIDCSGLVQTALTACGIACPRDSDMQEHALGEAMSHGVVRLVRGDLVFWNGHVAIVRDADTLLHANAFHMAVALEPAGAAIARIAAGSSEVTAVKRLRTG
jgi:cell wall-associated NlpC family hydrolase